MQANKKFKPSITFMLSCLTVLFIFCQLLFFIIHSSITALINALTGASISSQVMYPAIYLPILVFITCQIIGYILFTSWVLFITRSIGELFHYSARCTYALGIFLWCNAALCLLTLNQYFFPSSFFSTSIEEFAIGATTGCIILIITSSILTVATLLAYYHFYCTRHFRTAGYVLLMVALCLATISIHDVYLINSSPKVTHTAAKQPNIIFIGLDSVRPDFTSHYGNKTIRTPNIDQFLSSSLVFNDSYSPLARTFPSWVSILTGKHPVHSGARNNLINPAIPLAQDNLARELQKAGYQTIYASDEKRYSNLTKNYGFDLLIGPTMGAADFVLGGLGDSPMMNLIAASSLGRLLLPYNYGNRAAAITYYPQQFIQQIKIGLRQRNDKPVFLSIHFCLTHWPYTWASDTSNGKYILPAYYRQSVEMIDSQLGLILQTLRENGLLDNSLVVLLSDHGTSIGLPDDRITSNERYSGKTDRIKYIPVSRYSNAPENSPDLKYFSINTSYGQGTTVLSLKQNHTLLAFKRFGSASPVKQLDGYVALMDIAPTILDYLNLPPLKQIDGISLLPYFSKNAVMPTKQRPLFLETGDSFAEIITDHIKVDKVVQHDIGIYEVDPKTGLLQMIDGAAKGIVKNKELAIIQGDWLLAHIPVNNSFHFVISKTIPSKMVGEAYKIPPFYVLVNLKTRDWTIGLDTPFAKNSPAQELKKRLLDYYPGEITD